MPALSILDLARVSVATTARDALDNARDLAALAETLGYRRFWVAEHHNFPGIASAATALVIAHIAAGTRTIRVGAGGIMLWALLGLYFAFGILIVMYRLICKLE